jgi:hypothetical protein
MTKVLFWQLDILTILAEVYLHSVVSEFVQQLLHNFSLLVGNGADVLVG